MKYLVLSLLCLAFASVNSFGIKHPRTKIPRAFPRHMRQVVPSELEEAGPSPRSFQADSDDAERIVNGQETVKNKFPFMANLIMAKPNQGAYHFCGGSIYDATTVITAAHCVDDQTASDIAMIFGDWNQEALESTDLVIRGVSYTKHEQYNSKTMENDIAIIKLAPPISFTDARKPINLPSKNVNAGEWCKVIGWGDTKNTGPMDKLRGVDVPIISRAVCTQDGWYSPSMVQDKQICAGFAEGLKDSCQGDSGGPLFRTVNGNFEQVGVVSWGVGCADPKKPGVYQNVYFYKDWIRSRAGGSGNVASDNNSGSTSSNTGSNAGTTTQSPNSFYSYFYSWF